MNRRIALAVVMALALAPEMLAGTWLKDVGSAQKAAKERNQLILVDMFAQWCGWCHRFEKEVFPAPVFQDATKDMVLLRLDTEDRGEGTKLAQRFGITSLPTFLVLAPDLSLAATMPGYVPANDWVVRLKTARTNYSTFLLRVKNEDKLGKDWVQRLALAKEFRDRGALDKCEIRLKKLTLEKGVPAAIRDQIYFELAQTYRTQRRFDEGLKTIKQLTSMSRLGESVEAAQYLAALIYLDQGNLPSARTQLRTFLDTYPESGFTSNVETLLSQVEQHLAATAK